MKHTVFEKIINGDFEGSFVYKDDVCVAFMDIHPANEGHILVVPRTPVARLADLDAATGAHLFNVAQKILKALPQSGIRCEAANVFINDGELAGQEVPHVHIHIVPRFTSDGIRISFGQHKNQARRERLNQLAALVEAALRRV